MPLPPPKLTVVTPCFNSIHTIRETIESVRAQNYPELEHVVVDGGSRDGTLELIREYPHLHWISEKDDGHYHAMNKGIAMATGRYINILNADDCLRPGALAAVGEAFVRHPEWDALFGDIVFVDSAGRELLRREEAGYDYDVLRFSSICYVNHQALVVSKATYERLGAYRYQDYLNCCDYEFILRLGRAGCTVGHVNQLLINYRYHQHGQSADLRVTRNMAREMAAIRRDHGVPDGLRGRGLRFLYRARRQLQKLRHRGRMDLIPGRWVLNKQMHAKTEFSSNCGVDQLK